MVRGKVTDAGKKRPNARMFEEDEDEDYGIEPPKVDPQTVIAEARFLQKSGQYARAIERYSKVLEDDPSHVDALLARSQCYMDNGQLELSLKDADAAMKGYKRMNHETKVMNTPSSLDWKTQLQKADAMFSMGQFEDALVLYHRGRRLRPNIREFRLGITRCRDAITTSCLNGKPFKKGPTSRSSSKNSFSSSPAPSWRNPPANQSPVAPPPVAPPPASISSSLKTDIGHVRKLGGTHKYLKDLLQELDSSGKKYPGLASVTRDSLRFLGSRDTYWKQQMPSHVVARLEKEESHDTPRGTKQQPLLIDHIIKELRRINKDFQDGRYEDCVTMSQKCLKALDLYTDEEIQNKREIQGKIHSFLGSSYLEMGFLEEALASHNMDLEIAREIKSQKAASRSLENLGRVYAHMDRKQEAIDVLESKIPLCTETSERCWLFHELGYLYLDVNKPESAVQYGERAQEVAVKEGSVHSQLTAVTLIGQAHALDGNLEKSHDLFTQALALANQINDANAAEAIIQRLDELNKEMAASHQHETSDLQNAISDQQKATSGQKKATPEPKKATPNQQKATSNQQNVTPKPKKATPNQQKAILNQQDATPNQQKITPEPKKATPNQQDAKPNRQKAKPQQEPTTNNYSPRISQSQLSLKLPAIDAKPGLESPEQRNHNTHTKRNTKDAKNRNKNPKENKTESRESKIPNKGKVQGRSQSVNTGDHKSTPNNSAQNSGISDKAIQPKAEKLVAQNGNDHQNARKTDDPASPNPESDYTQHPSKPNQSTKTDETSLKPSNDIKPSSLSSKKDGTTSLKSTPQSTKAPSKPSNPNKSPKVRFQSPYSSSKRQKSEPESINEDIQDESRNLDRDVSGSVNNLRRIQQEETPRGNKRMQRPAMHDNRLEILPPSFSSASIAENV